MRINLIFRKPSQGQYSIEKVFKPLIPIIEGSFEVKCVNLPYPTSGIVNLLKNLLFLKKIQKADIYHITGDVQYASLVLPSKRTILTVHDLNSIIGGNGFQNWIKELLWFRLPLHRSALITCISQFTANELSNQFKFDENKLKIVHNPVEVIPDSQKSSNSKIFSVLQIGTKKNKNLTRLIQSLNGISCKLLIVGRLSSDQMLLLEKCNINFENYVDITDEEIRGLYYQCDLVSFISTYEGFGMPVLEAQSLQRPVIASNILPIREISGDAVEYVDPEDIDSIKKGFHKLMQSEEYRNKLIQKGLENSKRFTPEIIAMKYKNLYNEITKD